MIKELIIHPDELSVKWIDRLADAGVEVLGIHSVGGNDAALHLSKMLDLMKNEEFRRLIDYAKSRGLEIVYELHAAGYLMPKEHFDVHPEYYRMNDAGERTADHNLCVSSSDALSLFARNAARLAKSLYGSSDKYYFWMDDGHGTACRCPRCKKLSPSDQQLIAVNAMLREIKKENPKAQMAYLAYMDSIVTPNETVAEEGVFLEYAPFEKYTATGDNSAQLIRQEAEAVPALLEFFGREDAKVLEYWYDNSLRSNWTKPPKKFVIDKDGMKRDLTEYRALGFPSVASFACYLGADYEALHGDIDIMPFKEYAE